MSSKWGLSCDSDDQPDQKQTKCNIACDLFLGKYRYSRRFEAVPVGRVLDRGLLFAEQGIAEGSNVCGAVVGMQRHCPQDGFFDRDAEAWINVDGGSQASAIQEPLPGFRWRLVR